MHFYRLHEIERPLEINLVLEFLGGSMNAIALITLLILDHYLGKIHRLIYLDILGILSGLECFRIVFLFGPDFIFENK